MTTDISDLEDVIEDFAKGPTVTKYTQADVSELAIRLRDECIRRGGKQLPYERYEAAAVRRLEARATREKYTEPAGLAAKHERVLANAERAIVAADRALGSETQKYESRLSQEAIKVHGEIVSRERRQPSFDECQRIAADRIGIRRAS